MKVLGLGCITALGNDIDEVWKNYTSVDNTNINYNCTYDFKLNIKGAALRKMNRFSQMGVYCVDKSRIDYDKVLNEIDSTRIGTIFSTGYGPLNTFLQFAKQVILKDPNLCSPKVFSNTVSNAPLGHICMNYGYKGVSTMFTSSNNIMFSQVMLEEEKAEYIFSGYIDEYSEDLFRGLNKSISLEGISFAECAVVFLLSNKPHAKYICNIKSLSDINLGYYPLLRTGDKVKTINKLDKNLKKLLSSAGFTNFSESYIAFTSSNSTEFDEFESESLKNLLHNVTIIPSTKSIIGETLGSSFTANLMIAALCLKHNVIPKNQYNEKEIILNADSKIIVTGYDLSGNYMSAILSK